MSRLSPARRSEEGLFVLRGVDFQQKAFHAALVQADAVLRIADELVFAFLQLKDRGTVLLSSMNAKTKEPSPRLVKTNRALLDHYDLAGLFCLCVG